MKNSSIVFSLVCFFASGIMNIVSGMIASDLLSKIVSATMALAFLPMVLAHISSSCNSKTRIKMFGKGNKYQGIYLVVFPVFNFLFITMIAVTLGYAPAQNTSISPDLFTIWNMVIAAIMFFSIKYSGIAVRKQRIENEKLAVA